MRYGWPQISDLPLMVWFSPAVLATRGLTAALILLALLPGCRRKSSLQARARSACEKLATLTKPELPKGLALPPSATPTPLLRLRATGVQVYHCRTEPGGTWAWHHEGAEAELFDDGCALYGMLEAGPTWRALGTGPKGGRLSGQLTAQAKSSGESEALPARLYDAARSEGEGPLGSSQLVLEKDTVGGKSPPSGCDLSTADARVASPYQATLYFFAAASDRAKTSNPGPAAP